MPRARAFGICRKGRRAITLGRVASWPASSGHHAAVSASIGAGTTPGRVYPGKRMAGRYGGKQITTRGLVILKVDTERNLLVVKGSVPGKPGALLDIRPAKRVGSKAAN